MYYSGRRNHHCVCRSWPFRQFWVQGLKGLTRCTLFASSSRMPDCPRLPHPRGWQAPLVCSFLKPFFRVHLPFRCRSGRIRSASDVHACTRACICVCARRLALPTIGSAFGALGAIAEHEAKLICAIFSILQLKSFHSFFVHFWSGENRLGETIQMDDCMLNIV